MGNKLNKLSHFVENCIKRLFSLLVRCKTKLMLHKVSLNFSSSYTVDPYICIYLSKGIVKLHSTELFAILESLCTGKGNYGTSGIPLDSGHCTHVGIKENRA